MHYTLNRAWRTALQTAATLVWEERRSPPSHILVPCPPGYATSTVTLHNPATPKMWGKGKVLHIQNSPVISVRRQ